MSSRYLKMITATAKFTHLFFPCHKPTCSSLPSLRLFRAEKGRMPHADADLGLLPGDSEVSQIHPSSEKGIASCKHPRLLSQLLFEVNYKHGADKSRLAKGGALLILGTFGIALILLLGRGFSRLPQVQCD